MPLPLPNLDDRRWSDLVDEGRGMIPRLAPGWNNHNVSEPGITLMELGAWFTEAAIYELNRVPERHRRKFLALLGFTPGPPRPAQGLLLIRPEPGTAPYLVPAGSRFEATTGPEEPAVPFRSVRDLTVAPVTLAAVQVDAADGEGPQDRTQEWREGIPVLALGPRPAPGAALYLGFEELPAETPVALAFRWRGPGGDSDERARLAAEASVQQEEMRRVLPDIRCPGSALPPEPPPEVPPHHSARVVWEVLNDSWVGLAPIALAGRPGAGEVADDTRALTLDGIVEVCLEPGAVASKVGTVPAPLKYVRCRLAAGTLDAGPALLDVAPNAVLVSQGVPAWQTLPIPAVVNPSGTAPNPGEECGLRLAVDAVSAIASLAFSAPGPGMPSVRVLDYRKPAGLPGELTVELVLVGRGDGQPEQELSLPGAPVEGESVRLYSHDGVSWQAWSLRPDFDASGRADFHARLDWSTGAITGGSGERGRVFPRGALLFAAYRTTCGAAGNLAAANQVRPAEGPPTAALRASLPAAAWAQLGRTLTLRGAAAGGEDEESVPHATGRALETLYAHARLTEFSGALGQASLDGAPPVAVRALPAPERAVNLVDLERLALAVPGTRVARARAWAGVHPDYPCLAAPGCVTVVVMPDLPADEPIPSAALLATVRRYLDRRRMVAMQLHVVGPHYLAVRVQGRARVRAGADRARVAEAIGAALARFLDPRAGGPEGHGWPFGRDVYRTEILQQIDGVPGVDHVLELSLAGDDSVPRCGNLSLCPTWLARPGAITIEVE